MIVLAGKTCSGKSTVANLLKERHGYERVVTYTTRPPRKGENDGVEYNFVSLDKFEELKSADFFFETTSYNVASGETWHYGTSKESLTDDKIIVTNPDGLKKFKKLLDPDEFHIKVFYLNVKEGTTYNRLRMRGDDSDEAMRRIAADKKDFVDIDQYYDFAISTDSFNLASLKDITPEEVADLIDEIVRWERLQIS